MSPLSNIAPGSAVPAALANLPALVFLEGHPSPTYLLPLSPSSLHMTGAANVADDYVPEPLWSNFAASAASSHEGSPSTPSLAGRLDGDGRRALRRQLLALLSPLGLRAGDDFEAGEAIGGAVSKRLPSTAGSTSSKSALHLQQDCRPALVHGRPQALDGSAAAFSSVVALLPVSAHSSPSSFDDLSAHSLPRSTSPITPTQAREPAPAALAAAASGGPPNEDRPSLVVLQLHPMPGPAVSQRGGVDGTRPTRLPTFRARNEPLRSSPDEGQGELSATSQPAATFPSRSFAVALPTASLPNDDALHAAVVDPVDRVPSPARHDSSASWATPEEKAASRKVKFDMKGAVARMFADEASSPLKASERTASFKSTLSIVLNTETESALWWGKDHLAFYNDAYAEMLGSRHPALLGKPVREGWSELAGVLGPTFDRTIAEGVSLHRFNETFFLNRDKTIRHPEEVFHTWSLVPVEDEEGRNVGILNRSWETTKECLAERRLLTLRELAQNMASCCSVDKFAQAVTSSLELNPHDLPFVAIYISDSTAPSLGGSANGTNIHMHLKGSLGVPHNHPSIPPHLSIAFDHPLVSIRSSLAAPDASRGGTSTSMAPSILGADSSSPAAGYAETRATLLRAPGSARGGESGAHSGSRRSSVSLRSVDDPTSWPIRQALLRNEVVFVDDCTELVQGFESRSFGELPDRAVVMPAESDGEDGIARRVVVVLGLNTRRPYDEDYQTWLSLMRLSLASGLSAVVNQESQALRAQELARLDEAKTRFFGNVSHELRTPLSLISGPVRDLLLSSKDGSVEKQLLTIMHRNVQRLTRLVDMLMDVSRVEAGRMQGRFSPRHLGRFTADLASLFRSAIEKAGLKFVVEWDPSEQRCCYVDSDLWEKICFNLIGNALKYTLEGQIKVFVRYGIEDVEVGVKDTGVGIPKEDVPRVVERFHRVASTARSHEGTGVGLSLASDLIALHGGRLEVVSRTATESPDGAHGSLFVVRLPLGNSHLPTGFVDETVNSDPIGTSKFTQSILEEATTWIGDDDSDDLGITLRGASSGSSGDRESKGLPATPTDAAATLFWSKSDTVMIVDDNADMRRYLRTILEPFVTVHEAKDGQEALDAMISSPPNLILTDYVMPNRDGPSLITAVRGHPSELALVPVILITARAGDEEKVEGLTGGAEDFLPKPFASKELIARCHLQMQMGKRRIDLERRFSERTLELKIRAIEAEAKRKEAEDQKRQQELLVDVTSHELRNPVSAILQNSQLVGENLRFLCSELRTAVTASAEFQPTSSLLSMIEEDIESCEAIFQMAQSQERIANDVLSLARIQLSTLEIFPVPLDLIAETKRICSVFASECRLKQIQLNLVHGDSLKSLHKLGFQRIQADAGRLAQVLVNLLSNAIRFTTPAPVRKITVSIEVRKSAPDDDSCVPPPPSARSIPFAKNASEDEELYIYGSVTDSGPGLAQEELSRLFQRFRQASAQTHAVFGGSGLGLYVCRKICDLMDGKIEVVSSGRATGSTFRFYVKAALSSIVQHDVVSSAPQSPVPEPGQTPSPAPASPITQPSGLVLIVEDNLINQRVLRRQLLKANMRADVASDGAEALEKIIANGRANTPFAAILLDIEMPVMDGLTAIKTIRALERSGELLPAHTPVLALTGNARQAQIDAALAAGMDDVILKPYRIDNLLSKLRAVM